MVFEFVGCVTRVEMLPKSSGATSLLYGVLEFGGNVERSLVARFVPGCWVSWNARGQCVIASLRTMAIVRCMTTARKLLHTRYRVNDLGKTIEFYKQVLGLKEVRRHKSPRGSELVFLKAPESDELIEICCFPAAGPVVVQPDLTHLAFEVDSLETFGVHLEKLGLKFSDGPTLKPDGAGFAFIDAPEGYEIELMQRGKGGEEY